MTEQNLTKLTINTLTKSQYQALYNSGDISYTEIYLITDDNGTGIYALANNVYTKAEIDEIIANLPSGGGSGSGVDLSDYYTKSEITSLLANKANSSDLLDYVESSDLASVATSGSYNDLINTPSIPSKTSDLTNDSGFLTSSDVSTVATSGSYNDLTNKPDLSIYETKAEAFSGSYNDLTNKPDLSIYQTSATAFSGSYNDLTDKPTIPTVPTNISSFTNDSGYQTASNVNTAIATALTGYATESYVQTAVSNLGNVFTIKGSVSTVANLPASNNTIGDVYYVAEKQAGYIWIEIDNVEQWEELGETIDLSNYVQTSDLTWNNIQSKPSFATVATSGSYTDLTNKPSIPNVSGEFSGSNWTSITIGGTTKDIPSGGTTPSNMVTTNTDQNITAVKTFVGSKKIALKESTDGDFLGFTAYNVDGNEFGNLQAGTRNVKLYTGSSASTESKKVVTIGNYSNDSTLQPDCYAGFRIKDLSGTQRNFVTPKSDFSTYYNVGNANTYYIPMGITDGTTTCLATSTGIIDISSLLTSGGSSTPSNMVTTDTTQTITGSKTFTGGATFGTASNTEGGRFKFYGRNPIAMYAPSSSSTTGFTLFNSSSREKGYLQYNASQDALYLGRWTSNASSPAYAQYIGFLSEDNTTGYRVLIPNKTNVTGTATTTANTYYIPTEFTDGTTTIKATEAGVVDLSSLNLGGSGSGSGTTYTEGTGIDITNDVISIDSTVVALKSDLSNITTNVSGTNDGTNWTSITINGSTYNIPSGGSSSGSGSAGSGAIYYHNVRLSFAGSNTNYGKIIEFSILTKSATQILTMAELITQVAALQNEPYNDSVVGVIYGQVYQNNSTGSKEQILGFGLTGTSSNPNFYAVVRNTSGRTSSITMSINSNMSFNGSIQWINSLQSLRTYEVSASCYDIVTGGASSSGGSSSGIVDINDIPLVEGELAVKEIPLYDETTGEPIVDGNGDQVTEERLGIDDGFVNSIAYMESRIYALEQNSGGNVPTKTSDLINDSGFITSASVPSTATSTSTSTVSPSTIQLIFTFDDDTTQTVTLMTGATVSTTTTTTLS